MKKKKVGIVGATGLVGLEMQKILAEKNDFETRLFASQARGQEVLELGKSWDELKACDYVLGAATNEVACEVQRHLDPRRQMFIDNSSAFRMNPEVPLVVPEVNGDLLLARPPVVANPNCTAILLCLTLNALKGFGLARVVVSTYQAASGAGIKGLDELDAQAKAFGRGEALPPPQVFPFPLINNVLSHNTPIRAEKLFGAGYNEEEWKVIEETRKILDLRELPLSATCMRVPVQRAHTEAVTVDLESEVELSRLRDAFRKAPGLRVVDDWEKNHFPMPMESQEQDEVLVGRLRRDPGLSKTVHFILSGDQIRKGAALNAVQILRAAAAKA